MSETSTARKPIHNRQINCRGYLREDGLWDIEATLEDRKDYDFPTLERGVLAEGELVHQMHLRLTINDELVIQDVEAKTLVAPFSICAEVTENFKRLIGLKIGRGWRDLVRGRLGGVDGCTHLIEMLWPMATVAVQTIYPYRNFSEDGQFPMSQGLLNSCHGFDEGNEVVQRFWPEFAAESGDAPEEES